MGRLRAVLSAALLIAGAMMLVASTCPPAGQAVVVSGATAPGGGGGVTPPNCPYSGAPTLDGCSGANANASFLQASFAATARQSGQHWTSDHPWSWNAPGVDYPVGYDTTLTLSDPATASLPAGCSYTVHAGSAYWVRCSSGANNPTIQNLDFSRGGAHCVSLYFDPGVTGTITVKNNKFGYGAGECEIVNNSLIRADGGGAFNVTNNSIDEGSNASGAGLTLVVANSGVTGPVVIEYNYFGKTSNRDFSANPSGGSVTFKWNYVWGVNTGVGTGLHGEVSIAPAGAGAVSINDYNVIVFDSASQANTTTFFVDPPTAITYALYEETGNVLVSNKNAGAASVSYILAEMDSGASYTALTISNNYVDIAGALGCAYPFSGAVTTLTFTGNVSLNTGAAMNGFGSAAGTSNCR